MQQATQLTYSNSGNNFYFGFEEGSIPQNVLTRKYVPQYDRDSNIIFLNPTNHGGLSLRKQGSVICMNSTVSIGYSDFPISGPIRVPLIHVSEKSLQIQIPEVLPPVRKRNRYQHQPVQQFVQTMPVANTSNVEIITSLDVVENMNLVVQISGQTYSFIVPEAELFPLMLAMTKKGYNVD